MIVPWLYCPYPDEGAAVVEVWVLQYKKWLKAFDTKQDAIAWFLKKFPRADKRSAMLWML